jgi:hypothetical protein
LYWVLIATPIDSAQAHLCNSIGRQGWSDIQVILGNALFTFGEQTGTNQPLEEAVAAHHAALTERTHDRVLLDWATMQSNLGNALRTLGNRKKDATLICDALGKQIMAWEIFVIGSPYDGTRTAKNAKSTIATLENAFDTPTYEACKAQHQEALKRLGLL